MSSVWQQFTLAHLVPARWRAGSLLYHCSGSLRNWRQGSWLMQWAEPLGLLLMCILFGLGPFVGTALIGVMLLACAGFWGLITLCDDPSATAFTPIHLLVLLYWGVATVATAFSPVKEAALTGLIKLTLYLLLFVFMARILRSPRLRSWFITFYLHVVLVVSVYGLRQWFFGVDALATWVDPTSAQSDLTRVYSYLGNPNLLAGYLLPAIAFSLGAVFAWQGWLPKALAVTMVLVNSACLVLTFSRGGWLGFIGLSFSFGILLLYWMSRYFSPFWQRWALPVGVGGLAAAMVVAILILPPLRDRAASMFAGRSDSSNNFRINVWTAVLKMIRDRPILGIGPGNNAFNKVYPLYMQPRFSALSAYSVVLEILVETGIIGLTTFLWLLTVTFNQAVIGLRHLRATNNPQGFWLIAATVSLVGMLTHGLVDTVWYRPQVNTLWWLMMAMIASFYQRPEDQGLGTLMELDR
ncbi:MAG: putative bicarbonate transporter, IctB family [Oscillatoriales cyanobacterium RM1_1_9]|nr:putative bicarbonate transporter, IctB family [Oscillatoriales cyanobacterium RM1_1_9]